jgi:hypothetical protein
MSLKLVTFGTDVDIRLEFKQVRVVGTVWCVACIAVPIQHRFVLDFRMLLPCDDAGMTASAKIQLTLT